MSQANHAPYHPKPKRFVVREEANHTCCYNYSVHDTANADVLIAETFDVELADKIASAMNAAEGGGR